MNGKSFFQKDCMVWGVGLWLFGYLLGFLFYAFMPAEMIGWFITPIGVVFTCIVLWKWVHIRALAEGLIVGFFWSVIAIILDYIFIVKLLNPTDGYYKLDVYLYYASMFLLPIIAATLGQNDNPGLPD